MLDRQTFQPIQTEAGFLEGRDAIFLDKLDVDIERATLTLEGSFNGRLASTPTDEWIDYSLVFFDVLAFKVIELDSWDYNSASSFDQVVNSEWCAKLGGKVTSAHKHYLIQTYDEVTEVVCRKFVLTIKARRKRVE